MFKENEIREALEFAAGGGQALHVHRVIPDPKKAPSVFVREVAAGRDIAHLFDIDEARLRETAKLLGVSSIYVHRRRTRSQHVDLCAAPLARAIQAASTPRQGSLFGDAASDGPYKEDKIKR